mmetsp:Transcript_45440/g.140115  ORF Transcript_45440/g.140115 Transcript_45440/m.140115 type:complete len:155 (-) Transcript_45440:232-696(-)
MDAPVNNSGENALELLGSRLLQNPTPPLVPRNTAALAPPRESPVFQRSRPPPAARRLAPPREAPPDTSVTGVPSRSLRSPPGRRSASAARAPMTTTSTSATLPSVEATASSLLSKSAFWDTRHPTAPAVRTTRSGRRFYTASGFFNAEHHEAAP